MTASQVASLNASLADRYRLIQEIGRGGMATVYLALDLKLHRQVALKVLRQELAASLGSERFLREIEIAARLSHQHILPLHDSGEAGGYLYYVMPYVEGESLRQRLDREQQLPIADVVAIVQAVASALTYAHQEGIIHRDIKPENILLRRNHNNGTLHPLVADFGIARALDKAGGERLTETGIALGTPAYMSPEQAAAGRLDARGDIYALGCVAYEMLAGQPPFTGLTAQAILARHAVDPPPPLHTVRSTIPSTVEVAIERALAKVPADRFATADEFAQELTAERPTTFLRRRARSRGARIAMGVAAGAILVGTATIMLRGSSSPLVIPQAAHLAVLPFFAPGSDTLLSRLGKDLAVAIGVSLDGVGGIKVADRLSVAAATGDKHGLSAAEGAAVARGLGASSFLRGTMVRAGDNVRLDLGLFRTQGIAPLAAGITVTAHRDSIGALTDSATWSLLRRVWQRGEPPSPSLAAVTTRSIPALRRFLEGERELARANWAGAALAYQSAVAADSTFWLAHFRHALAQFWLDEEPVDPAELQLISRHRARLSEQERMLAEAFLAGDTANLRMERLQAVTRQFPSYWPGWLLYADLLHHAGPRMGYDWSEALHAFRRVVAIDPRIAPAWAHMEWLATGKDPAVVSEAHSRLVELGFPPPEWPDERFQFQLTEGVSRAGGVVPSDLDDIADSLARYMASPEGESMARLLALKLLQVGFPAAQIDLNQRALATGRASPDLTTWFRAVNGLAWAARGAWDSALTIMDEVASRNPGPYGPEGRPIFALESYGLAVIGAWIGVTSPRQAEQRRSAAVDNVRKLQDGEVKSDALGRLAWLDGILGFIQGKPKAIHAARSMVAQSGYSQREEVKRSLQAFGQALSGNRKQAGRALAELENECVLEPECNHRTPHIAVERLAAAQWLQESGDLERAGRLLRYQDEPQRGWAWIFRDALGGPTYFARARIEESRGQDSLAQEYYRQFIRRYDHPIPAQRHLVEEAKKALAKLSARADPSPGTGQ